MKPKPPQRAVKSKRMWGVVKGDRVVWGPFEYRQTARSFAGEGYDIVPGNFVWSEPRRSKPQSKRSK